jgi:acetyl-CoA carboxylase biotin carboxylase subunit
VDEGITPTLPPHQDLMVDAKIMDGGTNIHYLEEWLAHRSANKR